MADSAACRRSKDAAILVSLVSLLLFSIFLNPILVMLMRKTFAHSQIYFPPHLWVQRCIFLFFFLPLFFPIFFSPYLFSLNYGYWLDCWKIEIFSFSFDNLCLDLSSFFNIYFFFNWNLLGVILRNL